MSYLSSLRTFSSNKWMKVAIASSRMAYLGKFGLEIEDALIGESDTPAYEPLTSSGSTFV